MNDTKLKESISKKLSALIRQHGSASFALPPFQAALERTRPASIDPRSIMFTKEDLEKMTNGDFDALTSFALQRIDEALNVC